MRLDKFVSRFAESRKEAKKIISDGRILVNGTQVKDAGLLIDENSDEVCLDGEKLIYREFIYLMMNKPAGVVSATEDARQKTVTDILPGEYKRFCPFPVGRLDIDTEGLLILTNDGKAAHRLLSPKYKVPKRYMAVLDGDIGEKEIKKFKDGIVLDDGYKTMPAVLKPLSKANEVSVTITEGKFHQIKRMFADVGRKVMYLKRVEFASLVLDGALEKGEIRELTAEEVKKLQKIMQ